MPIGFTVQTAYPSDRRYVGDDCHRVRRTGGDQILDLILATPTRRISAANLFESYMVIDRSDLPEAEQEIEQLLDSVRFLIEPVTTAQVVLGREAFRRFGKGSGHQAKLNFGDCFAYALARFYDEPLLFIGNDFAATDIEPALPTAGI